MGIGNSIKGVYGKIEGKYFDFLDFLDSKGVPVYKLVDALEGKNIPSLPFFILLIIALAVLFLFAVPMAFTSTGVLNLTVVDEQDNFLTGANVVINDGEKEFDSGTTDEKGMLTLEYPKGKEFEIVITKNGFDKRQVSFTDQANEKITLYEELKVISKTISFKEIDTGELIAHDFEVSFSCPEVFEFKTTLNVSDGVVQIDDIPKECSTLAVASNETAMFIETGEIKISENEVLVSESELPEGDVFISVKDVKGNSLQGTEALLVNTQGTENEDDDITESRGVTGETGTVFLEGITTGEYYVLVYSDGFYADAKSESQLLTEGKEISFDVLLSESTSGSITVKVLDKTTNELIDKAKVKVQKQNMNINNGFTDETGTAVIKVQTNEPYDLVVDKAGYFIESLTGVTSRENAYNVLLEPLTEGNFQAVKVIIVDQDDKPVEGARVLLKKDETTVVDSKSTGFDGAVEFTQIKESGYFVLASKGSFGTVESKVFVLEKGETEEVNLKLEIAETTIVVNMQDELGNPIESGSVKLIDTEQEIVLKENNFVDSR